MKRARGVEAFDAMRVADAEMLLRECGASARWVHGMLARRPFGSAERLRAAADEIWAQLGPDDWREAFAHHPRIGDRVPAAAGWSAGEQAAVAASRADPSAAFAAINREYEARFGHIYVVCAEGKPATELLSIARARLANEPMHELTVAGEELRRIMQLRLAKALTTDDGVRA